MKKNTLLLLCFLWAIFIANVSAQTDSSLVRQLTLEVWDAMYTAQQDPSGTSAVVRHIPDGSLVTGVRCRLADDVFISPDPRTLVGKWPQQAVFTLKKGNLTQTYTVSLADYVPQEERVGGKWKLVWSEEFGGNEIDDKVWSKTPRNRANWGDDMTDDDRLYQIKDGVLSLKGMANTILPEDTAKYLTGGVWGKGKQVFMLGRIDVRARFSSAKGFWPAIWLLPHQDSRLYSENGEIDMVEHLNFDNFVYQTVHTGYTNEVNKISPKNHYTPPIDRDGFNVYTVEVYPDSLVYSVNGGKYSYTYPRIKEQEGEPEPFPFDHNEYYVVLSAQLGGQWVGEVGLKPDEVVSMDVDYVRYYRLK